jgi:serine/threonine protein kinase
MPEPAALPPEPEGHAPEPRPSPAASGQSSAEAERLLSGPPTDDVPTVISKAPPSASAEGGAANLRGRRLAHFELLEPIGVGGMAAVLRARDTQLDRLVALKILPPEMAREPENVRRFHQEARAAARLDHENIARVYFCGEDQGLHFIAFEFVEGENLRTLLERRGRLPVAEAIHYLLQVALALEHAASRGVVHRDIKPSNIIITPAGRAKLVDMGLARHLDTPADKGLTQPGVTLGTLDYISPEQALEPRNADVRSDIYSLGCTFYHMLTGQPPVPEGTAAYKLHFHQHLLPPDPRQLNPEIPDAVAAILSRMMAKDPKARYQDPRELVLHLLQVARELGITPALPEGEPLLVDTLLPQPPQRRLGLLLAVAAGGLAALLALLAWWPAGSEAVPTSSSSLSPAPVAPPNSPVEPGERPTSAPQTRTVRTAAELAQALAEVPQVDHIYIRGHLLLPRNGLSVVLPAGQTLTLEGADAEPATLEMHYEPPSSTGLPPSWAGFLVRGAGGQLICKNLSFVLHCRQTPVVPLAAVTLRQLAQGQFQRCAFRQEAPLEQFLLTPGKVPAASLALDAPGGQFRLEECYFVRGQAAVLCQAGAVLEASNCAFGPHGTLFHLRGPVAASAARLGLHLCSAFIVHGPAFWLDQTGDWTIQADRCLFSSPETNLPAAEPSDTPRLLQQSGAGQVHYEDRRTCYQGLTVFWARELRPLVTSWSAFRAKVLALDGPPSVYLPRGPLSPWQEADPLALLRRAEQNPWAQEHWQAFRVQPRLPQVRQAESGSGAHRPVGLQRCLFGSYDDLPDLPPPPLAQPSGRQPRIVDPAAPGGGGTYKTLAAALEDAEVGDLILIKYTGRLGMDRARLKPGQDVRVRPAEGYHPLLVLDTREADSALFQVQDARLRLQGLELELAPPVKEYRSQAIVHLLGSSSCLLEDCLLTFRGLAGGLRTAVLVEGTEGRTMTPTDSRTPPRLLLVNCLVRGSGDLLTLPQSRSLEVEIRNLALALDGSFCRMSGGALESSGPAGEVRLQLHHVTTYLTGHLLALEDRRAGKGLARTQVTARDCLFVTASGRPLVHVEGLEGAEALKRVFNWTGEHNWYSGFENILEEQTAMLNSMPLRIDPLSWGTHFRDGEDSRFARVKLALEGQQELSFSQVQPAHFQPDTPEAAAYGVDIEQLAEHLGLVPAAHEDSFLPSAGTLSPATAETPP